MMDFAGILNLFEFKVLCFTKFPLNEQFTLYRNVIVIMSS